jgi:hypothetical protein
LSQVRAAPAGKRGRGPARSVGGAEVGGGPRGAKRSGGRAAISPPKKGKNHRLLQLLILLRDSANASPAGSELHAWLV